MRKTWETARKEEEPEENQIHINHYRRHFPEFSRAVMALYEIAPRI